jgi:hypothetical protein
VATLLAWLGVILIVSVAGAGLVLSLDHAPTEAGRPELTARGHALIAPRLAALDTEMQRLATAGDAMATAGRDTLTRLRALDVAGTEAALTAGGMAATDVSAISERLAAARATLLDDTSLTALPTSDRLRIGTIDAAVAAAGVLPGYWEQILVAASDPLDLLRAMVAHDAQVVAATDSGRAAKWPDALAALTEAQRLLVPARAAREAAHKAGLDVTTLDDLLDRVDAYDTALTDLYTSLRASDGVETAESRAALERVNAAQESLPADQTAMVVVLSDLAGPTITPILLSTETARGTLEAALAAQPQATDAGSAPTGGASAPPATEPAPTDGAVAPSGAVSS